VRIRGPQNFHSPPKINLQNLPIFHRRKNSHPLTSIASHLSAKPPQKHRREHLFFSKPPAKTQKATTKKISPVHR
jgi:hypothetical protein